MDLRNFSEQIKKTGFVLENTVSNMLKDEKWAFINNKYYIDDQNETVREIDLIAYRVKKIFHINLYSTLIISCKKSEENVWAFLCRDVNIKDPNSDWWPLHAWSNNKVIKYIIEGGDVGKKYYSDLLSLGVDASMVTPEREIFAFQEMNKTSGKPQNDKSIFASITSLLKAQAYEISSLPHRKKEFSIYQFNLISVFDGDLVRLDFCGEEINCNVCDAEHYLARHIIQKREMFCRVRFIKASHFPSLLKSYSTIHEANCKWFEREYKNFYVDIFKHPKRSAVLIQDLKNKTLPMLSLHLSIKFREDIKVKDFDLLWNKESDFLEVGIRGLILNDDQLDFMNNDPKIKELFAKHLLAIYKYNGEFSFFEDIPF